MTWQEQWSDPATIAKWKEPSEWVVRFVEAQEVWPGMRALDLGCGPGRHAVYLASRGFDAYASDFTEEAVMLCRQALAEGGLKGEVQVADMARLPYPGAFFDLIVAYNVVYHTTRAGMKDVLAGLSRILKPGGSLLVTLKTPEEWVFGRGKEIEPDTFLREGKGVPIHFAREEEISDLLSPFEITSKEYHRRTKQIPGRGQRTHARWMIVARKPR